jgi:hypothetical protein
MAAALRFRDAQCSLLVWALDWEYSLHASGASAGAGTKLNHKSRSGAPIISDKDGSSWRIV